ncbi:hypothetical protein BLOT_012855 [Blomia tropicalis]|nr:hypothetical protein BLOT_012855 [Blomia tropicalis]
MNDFDFPNPSIDQGIGLSYNFDRLFHYKVRTDGLNGLTALSSSSLASLPVPLQLSSLSMMVVCLYTIKLIMYSEAFVLIEWDKLAKKT